MKSWERIVTIIGVLFSIGGAYFVLPWRMDAAERDHRESKAAFVEELKDIRSQVAVEKVKSAEVKEIVIRIEERLKGTQATVETMERRQRSNEN